ncbi:MAG: phosphatase PAP2 family protein [Clostridia bacterium]|nr:phosphatase PAP2 family protein [Clostridia bacterium]
MEFLYLLEKLRNPFFDFFFLLITHLGEEIAFLAIAIVFFWCVDKKRGYFILLTGLVGTVINQALKLVFKIPRPWIKDPNFSFVGDADVEATGYSFPSGHTQNTAGTFGAIALTGKRRWSKILCVVIVVLVAFSRMYLGVHTPLDVGVSLLVAAALLLLFNPIFKSDERLDKFAPFICIGAFILSLGLLLFTFLMSGEGVDAANLESGKKNAVTLFSCMLGFPIIYYTDKHFIRFETRAAWYVQIIKAVLGLGVVLAIMKLLPTPLEFVFGNYYVARGVRYFLIVIFAGVVFPCLFKYLSKIKIKCLDKLGETVKSLLFRKAKEIS